jgi:hypothetical protein
VEDTEQVEALSRPANFLRSCPNTSIRQALERHQERAGLGVHRGVHATSIPDISDVNDPRNQAVSGWLRGLSGRGWDRTSDLPRVKRALSR